MTAILKRLLPKTLFEGRNYLLCHLAVRGIKYLKPPPTYHDIQFPENRKLSVVPKVPMYPHGVKPPKMKQMIYLMRNPETIHNKLIYKQYGIQCMRGGRMKVAHFDVIRNAFHVKLDYKRMFAVWRVDAPWQARTKRPIGFTLGGGKGNIHHYVTPVGAGRIIVEVGGHVEFGELDYILQTVANKMPFEARAVSQKMLFIEERREKKNAERNINPYTYEYLIKNDMLGCRKDVKKMDFEYFGKYKM